MALPLPPVLIQNVEKKCLIYARVGPSLGVYMVARVLMVVHRCIVAVVNPNVAPSE